MFGIKKLKAQVAAGEAFKKYVHERLDEAGITEYPQGPHSAAGCRVGDRLDIALARAILAAIPEMEPT